MGGGWDGGIITNISIKNVFRRIMLTPSQQLVDQLHEDLHWHRNEVTSLYKSLLLAQNHSLNQFKFFVIGSVGESNFALNTQATILYSIMSFIIIQLKSCLCFPGVNEHIYLSCMMVYAECFTLCSTYKMIYTYVKVGKEQYLHVDKAIQWIQMVN